MVEVAPGVAGASVTLSGVELTGAHVTTGSVAIPAQGGGVLVDPTVSGVTVTLNADLVTQNQVSGANATTASQTGGGADGAGIDVAASGSPNLTLIDTNISANNADAGNAEQSYDSSNGKSGGPADGGGVLFASAGTITVN